MPGRVTDFHGAARPHVEALLDPGEALHGICAATQTSLFKGRLVALAATDRRLIVLPLNRHIAPDGEPLSITPQRLADAKVEGAGSGSVTPTAGIMSRAAVTLKLRTTDGEKLTLMMMRGGGSGPLGKLGGGEAQQQGVAAVGRFFESAD